MICPAPPQQGPNPSQQLGERKRLHKIIIGTAIQAEDAIFDRVPCGKHQDRCFETAFPERSQDFDTVTARKHSIQYDQVEGLCIDQEEAFLPCVRDRHFIPLCFQALLQRSCNFSFVLDNENAHTHLLYSARRCSASLNIL